jgi:hypothetical protein
MRGKGILYDTGFINRGVSSRASFDRDMVTRELRIIHDDLQCTAVRVTGGDPERLEQAARIAAAVGLNVWFSPFTCDLSEDAMLALLADCADRAERLRQDGATVVLVLGAEISLLNQGFLPGDTLGDRMQLLNDLPRLRAAIAAVPARVNAFLRTAVALVRPRFGGPITYASMPFEGVEWSGFDLIGVDLYRTPEVAAQFAAAIRGLVAQGKPVAITEFGSATYRGAAIKGARGGEIIIWDEETVIPLGLDGDYIRDEDEQAVAISDLVAIFRDAGVDHAFLCTFAQYQLPHRQDGRDDLDLASYGIVKVYEDRCGETYPELPWEPKRAFYALAQSYGA